MTPDPRGLPMVCSICGEPDAHHVFAWSPVKVRVYCRSHIEELRRRIRRLTECQAQREGEQ